MYSEKAIRVLKEMERNIPDDYEEHKDIKDALKYAIKQMDFISNYINKKYMELKDLVDQSVD